MRNISSEDLEGPGYQLNRKLLCPFTVRLWTSAGVEFRIQLGNERVAVGGMSKGPRSNLKCGHFRV